MCTHLGCEINEKESIWEELVKIKVGEECKQWCILVDFNAVRKK